MTAYRAQDLGKPISVHRFTLGTKLRVIALCFVGFPVGLTLLALTGIIPWGGDWDLMTYVGAAAMYLLMPGLGIKLWLTARARDRDVARIHDRGVFHVENGKERFIAWTDVLSLTSEVKQTVRNGIPGPVTHRHVLQTAEGPATFTHGYERIEELLAHLRERTLELIEPAVQERIKAKEKVAFGPISLDLKGVRHGGQSLRWKEIGDARFDAGELVVEDRAGAKLCSVPIAEVPNAHVLVELLPRMARLVK